MQFHGKIGATMACVFTEMELYEYPNISSAVQLSNSESIPESFFLNVNYANPHLAEMPKHHPVLIDAAKERMSVK